jgi:S1-C subfamily serine protease
MTGSTDYDVQRLIEAIKDASKKYLLRELSQLTSDLMATVSSGRCCVTAAQAKELINTLRGERRYEAMKTLADFFIRTGSDSIRLRTRYAQALIETGEIVAAIHLLERTRAAEVSADAAMISAEAPELPEIEGILGRAWKDIAVQNLVSNKGLAARALAAAYAAYRRGLLLSPDERSNLVWHGINLAGIQGLAKRHRLPLAAPEPVGALAERILESVNRAKADELEAWDVASAAEACIALNRYGEAMEWFRRYLEHPQLTGFHLGSTIRQLGTIWNLGETPAGAEILQLLVRFQLNRQDAGSEAILRPDQMAAIESYAETKTGGYYQNAKSKDIQHGIHDGGRAIPLDELMTALSCAKSIGLVRRNFEALGTAFVASAKALGLALSEGEDDRVLITNSHVVSDPPDRDSERNVDAAHPQQATVTFTYPPERAGKVYRVKRVAWNSRYLQHDVSVLIPLELFEEGIEPLPVASWPPFERPDKAYIVGHPLGQTISFSFDNNKIVQLDDAANDGRPLRIYYGTPTSPGNSGSPVFNERWEIIGVHHVGNVRLNTADPLRPIIANEGILIASVHTAIGKINVQIPPQSSVPD